MLITNHDAAYTWAGTATASGTVAVDGSGLVTVTGVAAGTASIATITTTRAGYLGGSAATPSTTSLAPAGGFSVYPVMQRDDQPGGGLATSGAGRPFLGGLDGILSDAPGYYQMGYFMTTDMNIDNVSADGFNNNDLVNISLPTGMSVFRRPLNAANGTSNWTTPAVIGADLNNWGITHRPHPPSEDVNAYGDATSSTRHVSEAFATYLATFDYTPGVPLTWINGGYTNHTQNDVPEYFDGVGSWSGEGQWATITWAQHATLAGWPSHWDDADVIPHYDSGAITFVRQTQFYLDKTFNGVVFRLVFVNNPDGGQGNTTPPPGDPTISTVNAITVSGSTITSRAAMQSALQMDITAAT